MPAAPFLRWLQACPPDARWFGPFRLLEKLGQGGFAPVWKAQEIHDETVLRTVAIKLFDIPRGASGASRRHEVITEAQRLCQVEHPNIVKFHALHIDEDRGGLGLVMELVAGRSLHQRLLAQETLPARDVIEVGLAIAAALGQVHRGGLVHRDVKPANIVEQRGTYKLIDFGIAAAESRAPPEATSLDDLPLEPDAPGEPQFPSGTPGYMDPACLARGEPASAASDLYALGATLFECLTGKLPAAALLDGAIDQAVIEGRRPPPAIDFLAPATPAALASLVDALLSPERGQRPPSAEAVARSLLALVPPARAISLGMVPVEPLTLCVDSRPLLGPDGKQWHQPAEGSVQDFLNDVWNQLTLQRWIPPFTYGSRWLLRDASTGMVLYAIGSRWARDTLNVDSDVRPLSSAGLAPGMTVSIVSPPTLESSRIIVKHADLSRERVAAVVCATGSPPLDEVAQAIHRAAGPRFDAELAAMEERRPGEATLTAGHDLLARYIIHITCPPWRGDGSDVEALRACYAACLRLAELCHARTVALPVLGGGAFPGALAATIAVAWAAEVVSSLTGPEAIVLCARDWETYLLVEDAMRERTARVAP